MGWQKKQWFLLTVISLLLLMLILTGCPFDKEKDEETAQEIMQDTQQQGPEEKPDDGGGDGSGGDGDDGGTDQSCEDIDEGINLTILGAVSGIDENGESYSYVDYCTNSTTVVEYYCEDLDYTSQEFECAKEILGTYCEMGACVL